MSFGMAYATKKRGKKVNANGEELPRGHGKLGVEFDPKAAPREGYPKTAAEQQERLEAEHAKVSEHYRRRPEPLAEGGEVSEHEQDADMIARIMHKRKEYSKGGEVANDVGVAEADKLPAEFDDLELDDHLDGSQPVDSNERGDADVSDDPIDRLMMKRKKDKLPRPA